MTDTEGEAMMKVLREPVMLHSDPEMTNAQRRAAADLIGNLTTRLATAEFQNATLYRQLAEAQEARDLNAAALECYSAEQARLRKELAEAQGVIERLKNRIDTRLNNYLCEMKPGYDDSIVGFNEAWDIVRKCFPAPGPDSEDEK